MAANTSLGSTWNLDHPSWDVKIAPISDIRVDAQPRVTFDEDELAELAASIDQIGLLQPLIARLADDRLVLVSGERRLRACVALGWTEVPVVVMGLNPQEAMVAALVENVQRVELNPLEEAATYRTLLEDLGLTQDDLAAKIGKSRPYVTHHLGLLRLPPEVQRRVAAGVLSVGHAKVLMALKEPWVMSRLAARIVSEGLSVRATEEIVALGDLPGWEDDAQTPPRPPRPPRPMHPLAQDVSTALADALETSVRVTMGRRGRIVIDFADEQDLLRIWESLSTSSVRPEPTWELSANGDATA
jgi:ParB family chromosome partitioning protein